MQSMLILTLAAATTGSALQATQFTAMQKTVAFGKGVGLAGLGFVLFGKGLDAMSTVTQKLVAPGVESIRRSAPYQNTIGRLFRKPSAKSKISDLPKDFKKNLYILAGISGSILLTPYLTDVKSWLVVGA